jgi:hypothetical protein
MKARTRALIRLLAVRGTLGGPDHLRLCAADGSKVTTKPANGETETNLGRLASRRRTPHRSRECRRYFVDSRWRPLLAVIVLAALVISALTSAAAHAATKGTTYGPRLGTIDFSAGGPRMCHDDRHR